MQTMNGFVLCKAPPKTDGVFSHGILRLEVVVGNAEIKDKAVIFLNAKEAGQSTWIQDRFCWRHEEKTETVVFVPISQVRLVAAEEDGVDLSAWKVELGASDNKPIVGAKRVVQGA